MTKYSLVVKMSTLTLLLGVVAREDLELQPLDVKTVFLHGDLDEDNYMSQPTCFRVMGEESHLLCGLKKSLYGLKQASRMSEVRLLHLAAWLPPVRLRPMYV